MGGESLAPAEPEQLVALFERALPQVYDYLLHRVGDRQVAEDLTSETLLGAYAGALQSQVSIVSVGWLIGIARHKLIDHWRSVAREDRRLTAISGERADDGWDEPIEPGRAAEVLAELNPTQRAALTFRYIDDLSVPAVAELLGRSVGGTEVLLVRAKQAFRDRYGRPGGVSRG